MRNGGNRPPDAVFGKHLRFQPGLHGHEGAAVAKGSRVAAGCLDAGRLEPHEPFAAQEASGWSMPTE